MTRNHLVAAIKEHTPFRIRMAEGKEYRIPHPDYISLSPHGTVAIVYDEVEPDFHYTLPLLTMTGIVHEHKTHSNGNT